MVVELTSKSIHGKIKIKEVLSMKKLIAIMMCAVLMLSVPTTAFAAESPFYGEGTAILKYKSYSTCTVTIPETIEITGQPTEITVTNPNVESGYCVNVYVTNLNDRGYIDLTQDSSGVATVEASFINDSTNAVIDNNNSLLASIECSDNSMDTYYATFSVSVIGGNYRAGNYTGTMQYDVRIEPINQTN